MNCKPDREAQELRASDADPVCFMFMIYFTAASLIFVSLLFIVSVERFYLIVFKTGRAKDFTWESLFFAASGTEAVFFMPRIVYSIHKYHLGNLITGAHIICSARIPFFYFLSIVYALRKQPSNLILYIV